MSMTLEQAKSLEYHDEIHHDLVTQNKGKDCWRARLTSYPKTWKRSPERVEIRFVHGLKGYDYINESYLSNWHLASECPRNEVK
jgi:hypothetical protein